MPDYETALDCGVSFDWLGLAKVSALSPNGQHDEGFAYLAVVNDLHSRRYSNI